MASFYGGIVNPEILDIQYVSKILMPSFVMQYKQNTEDGILKLKNNKSNVIASLIINDEGILDILNN